MKLRHWKRGAYVEPYLHDTGRGGCNPIETGYKRLGSVYKNPAGGFMVIVGGKRVQVQTFNAGKLLVEEIVNG